MLFDGVKLLFTNWRFTLIQVLPVMWIWAAMLDLKDQPGPVSPGRRFGMGRGRRPPSRDISFRRLRLGRTILVHRLSEHRHRGDDDLLRRRAVPAHRHKEHSFNA
jgi:hypothetical protein